VLLVSAAVDDGALLAGLRAGDEAAFAALVARYHGKLLRLAETMVPSRAVAEEVVQDTWLAVVRGVRGFEGRSSFRTWLFHILVNRARSTGVREHRTASLDPEVIGERFDSSGHWSDPPTPWVDDADNRIDAAQLAEQVRACLPELPESQRQVVLMRDVEGLAPPDVCRLLGISDGNLRVLLHRGRAQVRRLLAERMGKP
jgi:RNA polymerase sigma-70 factor, ECF subfamily